MARIFLQLGLWTCQPQAEIKLKFRVNNWQISINLPHMVNDPELTFDKPLCAQKLYFLHRSMALFDLLGRVYINDGIAEHS